MKIKGMGGEEHSVTSQGQGNLNTVLGAIGTAGALGIMGNGCGNGFLGGLFGGNGNCNGSCPVTEKEFAWAERYNQAIAENSRLSSENFTRQAATKAFEDSVTYAAGLNDKQAGNLKELYGVVIAQGQEIAVLKSDLRCLSVVNEKDHEIITQGYKSAVALEAERRAAGDENLAADFNAKLAWKASYSPYINGQQVFCPNSSICGGELIAGGCATCSTKTKS